MTEWSSFLNDHTLEWLLEDNNPSARFFTLKYLLGKWEDDSEISEAKRFIMEQGYVERILSRQDVAGHWDAPDRFYNEKYKGTVWQLIILAELGADGNDPRIRKACKFILNNSQDLESGGFSIWASKTKGGGRHSGVIPCLTGNMVWSLIRMGYLEDPRVQKGIEWMTRYQRFDDKDSSPPKEWPYDKYESCWGSHTCHMGVVKVLKALSEIPEEARSEDVRKTICDGAEYMFRHHIYKRSHDLGKVSKPSWLKFGFPKMWQTDALEIALILIGLGYRDPRMQDAIDLIISKQDADGRWLLESTFNGKFQINIERKGKPSKFVTINALRVLKGWFGP